MGWKERPVLWSAEAKFRNGSDHLDTLKNDLLPWTKREVIALTLAKNADATEHSLIFSWIEEPPIERWGLLIGDCLHNLRSSLDHAVYGLAAANSGADPPPHADALAFPVCDTDALFKDALGRHRLGSLASDVNLRAAIEGLQPYRRPNPPYEPVLAILRDLDNRDKHKLVSIIAAGLHTGEVETNIPPMDPWPRVSVRFWTRGPMQESTEVFTVVFDRPAPDVQMSSPNLSIYPAIEVGKLDGTTEALGLTTGLGLIRDEVRYCLDAMSRFL
jgi:hypothetical protein